MKLLPLDSPELIQLVAGWLGKPDNYKWLDFGNGVQMVTPITLKIMTQRDIHVFRAYTANHGDVPAGMLVDERGGATYGRGGGVAPVAGT